MNGDLITADAEDENKPGVYLKTFGCQMNEYDSEKLLLILSEKYRAVQSPEQADLVIVNTCSVRDKPEQKLYSLLGELNELKKGNKDLLIGVGGCVAQQEGKKIVDRSSAVDFVFGTHNLSLVPALIERRQAGARPPVAVDYRDEWEELPLGFTGQERTSVFVSVSRGCNKNCSYCIVPTTRGSEVSRNLDEILREVRIAAHRGAREVVLLGQTVNSWGLDLNPRHRFADLLNAVSEIEDIKRIRFISPHPQEVRSDFIRLLVENPKICRHVHLPLQSGSDRILELMNRNYRVKRYLEIIDQIRSQAPDTSITTDIIVGFPGESEEDFKETMRVLERVAFDNSYSFIFSPRPGTVAAKMPETITAKEKLARLQVLQARQLEFTEQCLSNWIGKEVEVLIEGPSQNDPGRLQGRTSQNITLNLTNENSILSPGDIVRVVVSGKGKFTLKAEHMNPARELNTSYERRSILSPL